MTDIAMQYAQPTRSRHDGFTLVEVLIALVVLSIGLLGLASLQTNALKFSHSGYQHSQATFLAYDILDRMRANRTTAMNSSAYKIGLTASAPTAPNCVTGTCSPSQMASFDLAQWKTLIETTLPGGQAEVDFTDAGTARIYIITVRWNEMGYNKNSGTLERGVDTITIRSEI